jgi:hypothetical protein
MLIVVSIGFLIAIIYMIILQLGYNKIRKKFVEHYINENINRYIIEAQLNYSDLDNIELISRWITKINPHNIPPIRKKIFKEFVKKW